MLTGDRIGGALNARQLVATLGLAETLTPARNERTRASPAWRRPLPLGRLDQTSAIVFSALLVPASAADPSGTRQMAGRARRKNGQGCRLNDEAGRPASCWQNRLHATCADRFVAVRSAPASSARTQSRRCEPTIKNSDEPMRGDATRPGAAKDLTKSRRNGPCGGYDRR
jgi:hypothetical protein